MKWWRCLAGDCCPISLIPLEELTCEPFGILGTSECINHLQSEGIWGPGAVALALNRQPPAQAIHWFDGMFLASFLVSSGQLIDPVNRRALTRGECVSLDEYLEAHGLPPVHVADVFDLARAVSGQQAGNSGNLERIASLEREAASMLRSLFDFRSAAGAQPPPPPPREREPPPVGAAGATSEGTASTHAEVRRSLVGRRGADEDDSEWPGLGAATVGAAAAPRRQLRSCTQRMVHSEGGLTVIDDGEFDEEWEEDPARGCMLASGPTPAEAVPMSRGVGRARVPRMPPAPRGRGASRSGAPEGAQVTFAVTGRPAREAADHRISSSPPGADAAAAAALPADVAGAAEVVPLSDVWIPEWATPDLHERLLGEIEVVEAMYSEDWQLLSPGVRTQLQECAAAQVVSRSPEPLRFEVRQTIGSAGGGFDVVAAFSLPPFYPVHTASVSLREASTGLSGLGSSGSLAAGSTGCAASTGSSHILERLQAALRSEVLHGRGDAGTEVVLAALDWLVRRGPAELARLREAGSTSNVMPSQSAGMAESKRERVEQARKDRMCGKYTPTWDLCYAFMKHGSCKDKNCQWRHEAPGKPDNPHPSGSTLADAGPASSAEQRGKRMAGKRDS